MGRDVPAEGARLRWSLHAGMRSWEAMEGLNTVLSCTLGHPPPCNQALGMHK